MKLKRILSCALACALAVTLALPLVQQAHAVSFSDISDGELADNVAVLHTLGVVDGTGKGAFNPKGTLTRAEFCKMAVVMMGQKGAVGQNQSFTIFPDVRADHWAAGYINVAVRGSGIESLAADDNAAPAGPKGIIAGYPDGRFHPNDKITFAQTVTILMRMLGYQDTDVGAVWPYGYLNAASANGLTEGLKLSANAPISRANAAKLFSTLLLTDQKSGGSYASKLGTLKSDVIIMDAAATAPDGTKDAVKIQDGTIHKIAERSVDAAMAGRKGSLLLDEAERVLTFIPDRNGKKVTITVSEAKADGIVDTSGTKTEIHSSTVAYYRGEAKTYGEVFFDLRPGTTVTVYYNGAGRVEYVFAGASPADDAVVITENGSTADLSRLTDSQNYTIYKNGTLASTDDLRQYDVATYDKATNSIRVSDARITGYYADAEPNISSPSKITMLGHPFNVLPTAAPSMGSFKIGDQVTLLLTEDHQVAGAADPKKVEGNAIGIVTSVSTDKAKVELFCGLTIEGNPKLSAENAAQYQGQLVKVSSYQKGDQITLSRVSSGNVRGDFLVKDRTVGGVPLAKSVRIFDKVSTGPLVSVGLSDIPADRVSASQVAYAEKNYANEVTLLILNNVTGDAFTYGRYQITPAQYDDKGHLLENPKLAVVNGDGASPGVFFGGGYQNGGFGGLAFYESGSSETRLAATAEMTQLKDVPNAAWNDSKSVTMDGSTYPVAEKVACYNKTTDKWVTLAQARAFSDKATVYYDNIGKKIRIVVVEQ